MSNSNVNITISWFCVDSKYFFLKRGFKIYDCHSCYGLRKKWTNDCSKYCKLILIYCCCSIHSLILNFFHTSGFLYFYICFLFSASHVHLKFNVDSERQIFEKFFQGSFILLSEFLPDVFWEEVAEEIFFIFNFFWWLAWDTNPVVFFKTYLTNSTKILRCF